MIARLSASGGLLPSHHSGAGTVTHSDLPLGLAQPEVLIDLHEFKRAVVHAMEMHAAERPAGEASQTTRAPAVDYSAPFAVRAASAALAAVGVAVAISLLLRANGRWRQ